MLVLIIAIVAVAITIRLDGLDGRVLSHPENFVPGLDMPDWVDWPPERLTMMEVLRGTPMDGHPPAYFLAMVPWVNAFGTSLFSLRLPSALLGAASVFLLFLIGKRAHGPAVGLLAAALLAVHSHHIYWSQMARMYVPVAFLGLLSTLWLLKALEDGRVRSFAIYLGVTALALWTQLYAWPLLVGQVAWVVMGALAGRPWRRVLRTQVLAFVIGAPVVQLSLYQVPSPQWFHDARGYLEFGYLFDANLPFWGARPAMPNAFLVMGLCLALVAMGMFAAAHRTPRPARTQPDDRGFGGKLDWALGTLVMGTMLVLAWRWLGSDWTLWAISALPLVMVAGGLIADGTIVRLRETRVSGFAKRLDVVSLATVLAFLPVGIMLAVSQFRGVYVERGTVVFLPYLLLLVACGFIHLLTRRSMPIRTAGLVVAGATGVIFAAAFMRVRVASGSPRDYESLGRELTTHIKPDDLVLVKNDWNQPPLFYYLDRSLDHQLVHQSYKEAVDSLQPSRVWLVRICGQPRPEAEVAVGDMYLTEIMRVTRAELWLYGRQESGAIPAVPGDSSISGVGCKSTDPVYRVARQLDGGEMVSGK